MALQIFTSLLRSGPVVKPAGMTLSVPCHKLDFGSFRHLGASYTMAMWLLKDHTHTQVAEQGEGGGDGGRRMRVKWGISSLRRSTFLPFFFFYFLFVFACFCLFGVFCCCWFFLNFTGLGSLSH